MRQAEYYWTWPFNSTPFNRYLPSWTATSSTDSRHRVSKWKDMLVKIACQWKHSISEMTMHWKLPTNYSSKYWLRSFFKLKFPFGTVLMPPIRCLAKTLLILKIWTSKNSLGSLRIYPPLWAAVGTSRNLSLETVGWKYFIDVFTLRKTEVKRQRLNIWRIFIDTILSSAYAYLGLYASKHTAIHTLMTRIVVNVNLFVYFVFDDQNKTF